MVNCIHCSNFEVIVDDFGGINGLCNINDRGIVHVVISINCIGYNVSNVRCPLHKEYIPIPVC